MPTRIDLYRFNGQTRLSADTFNRVFTDVDLRIAKLESLEIDWEAATRELTALGLSRINEVLNPLLVTGEATLAELVDALENLPNNPVTIEQLTTILLGYVTPDALALALAPKADTATVNAQLLAKADKATVDNQLIAKANRVWVEEQLAAIDTGQEVITTLTASTTLTLEQAGQVFVDASGGPITLALPASTSLVSYRFTRVDATTNQVTINRAGTDLLGVSGVTFAPLDGAGYTLRLTANGAGRWMRTYSSPITFRWDVPGTYQWRRPLDATHGELLIIGAGGGAASGGRTSGLSGSANGGQGGGGGSAVKSIVQLPASATITVGAGGNGGAQLTGNGNGHSGAAGASSAFGTIVVSGGVAGTSPPTAPAAIPQLGSGAMQASTPRAGLASHDLSFAAVTAVPFTTDSAMDDDGSGAVTLIKTITPTMTSFDRYQFVWPAGCSGGWGANSFNDNTPGFAGADHGDGYSGLASGPSGAGGKSRRGANADPGQPGGIGSGGGGGGASHNGNSGAGGPGGPGLVVITCL